MSKTTFDLKDIARVGGGISVDAATRTTFDLKDIARVINSSGGTLIVRNADIMSTFDLKDIGRVAPGKVIFEL